MNTATAMASDELNWADGRLPIRLSPAETHVLAVEEIFRGS